MYLVLILVVVIGPLLCAAQEPCNLFCGGGASGLYPNNHAVTTNQGPPGKKGPPGVPGSVIQCDCTTSNGDLCQRIKKLSERLDALESSNSKLAKSCEEVKRNCTACESGIYTLQDSYGIQYKTYCDMDLDNGGWTLVASVHDNNLGPSGRCTIGDRWSSEQGRSDLRPSGDGNWQNRNTFGEVTKATVDDFKNPAYYELQARDMMIWHVPNDTPLRNYSVGAYLKYRTNNGFLANYGGNLFHLYSQQFPITSGTYSFPEDSGPAIPIVFDIGDAQSLLGHLPPNAQTQVDPGYIQFRAIGAGTDAYALCPGVRKKQAFQYPSYACVGSTGQTQHPHYCGDLSSFFYEGSAAGTGWSGDDVLITTTFMIFYR